ncbi:hypothetical protein KRR39_08330 [Nocardioides panacis]|jgi:hypothetical protein|uniref:Uncharacterized protein n=1 Tax=Nocardioides panacis TaxID=2849501 RepID=A0A975T164_9ACTN|nr:hypothetical protein [Nocardioides panacis]QWZ09730.1 hypothetical protein KRR39_08330 [Nocardioides panacis]
MTADQFLPGEVIANGRDVARPPTHHAATASSTNYSATVCCKALAGTSAQTAAR